MSELLSTKKSGKFENMKYLTINSSLAQIVFFLSLFQGSISPGLVSESLTSAASSLRGPCLNTTCTLILLCLPLLHPGYLFLALVTTYILYIFIYRLKQFIKAGTFFFFTTLSIIRSTQCNICHNGFVKMNN